MSHCPAFKADGGTFEGQYDSTRLGTQFDRVRALMADGQWRTLREIADAIGKGSEAAISARLRDLRKPEYGRWTVERRRRGDPKAGLWEYQVSAPKPLEQLPLIDGGAL